MNDTLRNKFICLLAAVAMLISGMCLELPQTDSSFAYYASNANTRAMLLLEQDSPGHLPDSCTLRMLGQNNPQAISTIARRQNDRSSGRNNILHFLSDHISVRPDNLVRTGILLPATAITSHYHIIQFIHRGDGTK